MWLGSDHGPIGWVKRHKLPVCVFGSLLAVLVGVTVLAAAIGEDDFWKHVLERNRLHLLAGGMVYLLLMRLTLLYERLRNKRRVNPKHLGWFAWYFAPFGVLMAFVLLQEFGLSMAGETWLTPGGDWRANAGHPEEQAKSLADIATWAFGALCGAWFAYYMPERLWQARQDYLRSRS